MATCVAETELVPAEVFRFAAAVAARPVTRCDLVLDCADFEAVGTEAAELAAQLFSPYHTADASRIQVAARYVGWLVYAIDRRGCSFDDVLRHTNLTIAEAVAGLSEDLRLIQPRRVLERRSRFSEASPLAQLAALAELRVQLRRLQTGDVSLCEEDWLPALRSWLDEQVALVDAMSKLRRADATPVLREVTTALEELRKTLKRARTVATPEVLWAA